MPDEKYDSFICSASRHRTSRGRMTMAMMVNQAHHPGIHTHIFGRGEIDPLFLCRSASEGGLEGIISSGFVVTLYVCRR